MIGGMVPSGKALAALLALALSAFAVGCDATGGDDEDREVSSSEEAIGEGASEFGGDEAPGSDAADPPDGNGGSDDTHVDGQTGIGSPLDDRGGPDPIPWHRSLLDERANDT